MREIGQVKLVQIQRWAIKVGEGTDRRFDPAGIMKVDALQLSPKGVIGITADTLNIVDVHHTDHTHSRNNGTNSISIGLTSHYNTMRDRFGNHLTDGIAGENIIIDAPEILWLEDLQAGLVFQSQITDEMLHFDMVKVMAPCEQFSQFCARERISGGTLKEVLQFLNDGRRGFSITPALPDHHPIIRAGDRVYVKD